MRIPARQLLQWVEYLDETRAALTLACEKLDISPMRSELFAAILKVESLRSGLLYHAVEDVEVG